MSGPARSQSIHAYDPVKRIVDVSVAAIGLLVTAPLQLVTGILVAVKLGRPVLFRQQRPGRDGKPFTLVKFRTMNEPDRNAGMVTDAERMTKFGRRLRATSLDELPTLWNVLRGDMSLVGPRPLLMQYLDRYSPAQARRHEVRPGITGLAQVSGRNELSWEVKLAADVAYVDRRSAILDGRILLRTAVLVLRRDGISAAGHVTIPEFLGTSAPGGEPS